MGPLLSPHPRSIFKSVLEKSFYTFPTFMGNLSNDRKNRFQRSEAGTYPVACDLSGSRFGPADSNHIARTTSIAPFNVFREIKIADLPTGVHNAIEGLLND